MKEAKANNFALSGASIGTERKKKIKYRAKEKKQKIIHSSDL
jgi:hypothetical protein